MSRPPLSLQDRWAPANRCFGCGPANPAGLRIKSFPDAASGDVVCSWKGEPHHEAFDGMLNGGIIGALFDCHCNWTALHHMVTTQKLERARREHGVTTVPADEIYGQACDIFAPYALGAVINDTTLPQLRCVIVCGSANNQLAEERHGDRLHERGILYAPDYIANAGGTIYDTDRLKKGGFNRERAWKNVAGIGARMTEVIEIARRERMATWRAADRLAEQRLAMARSLRMI